MANIYKYDNENNEEQPKKKKKFFERLMYGNDEKGVSKDEKPIKLDFRGFFVLFGRRIGKLLELNILFILSNFPIFFILFALSGYSGITTTAPSSVFFANLHPIIDAGEANPVLAAIYGIHGIQGTLMARTTLTYVLFGLGLLLIFTIGLSSIGMHYVLRNIVKLEPIFLLSDYFTSIKKNWKQGLIYGIIDCVLLILLFLDIYLYSGFMKYMSMAILALYLVMRTYIYLMLPTFKISIFKAFKNALLFIVINLKRNIVSAISIIFVVALNIALLIVYMPIGMILPFILTVSVINYIAVFTAWPSIKKVMIDPQVVEEDTKIEEEPVFHDQG